MKLKLIGLAALVSVVLLLGLTACSAQDIQSLQGILKNVDTVSGNLTLTLKDGSTFNYSFADINPASILDSQGNLRFNIGDNVTLQIYKHGNTKLPQFPNACSAGTIKTIGTDNITITTEHQGDITLQVTPQTLIITKSTGKGTLADLTVGQKVEATYEKVSMKAIMIKVDFQIAQASAVGTIKTVYSNNSTLTITTLFRGDITLLVTADTMIRIGGKGVGAFSDLQAGQKVEVNYEVATMKALKISTNALWKKPVPGNGLGSGKIDNNINRGKNN
jgi:Cu/Ag efflux protein CusF